MPGTPTYPGVYVEEIPSGSRTIAGVATSITAFIGRAQKGPVNDPILINNYGDFERIFGGLWEHSNLGFAVRDFYNNGGSQAIIVRLYNPPDNTATIQNSKLYVPISEATVTSASTTTATVSNGTATIDGTATVIGGIVKGETIAITPVGTSVTIAGGTATVTASNSSTVTAAFNQSQIKLSGTLSATIKGTTDAITNSTITITGGTVTGETITVHGSKVRGQVTDDTATGTTATVTGGTATVTNGTATISSSGFKKDKTLKDNKAACGKIIGSAVTVTGNKIVTSDGIISIAPSTVTGNTGTVTSSNSHPVKVEGTLKKVTSAAAVPDNVKQKEGQEVTVTLSSSVISGNTVTVSTISEVKDVSKTTATVTGGTATISGGTVTVTKTGNNTTETMPIHMVLEAASPGTWGDDLEAVVDHNFPKAIQNKVADEKLFNLSIENKVTKEEEKFHSLSEDSNHKRYVKNVLNNESRLVQMPESEHVPGTPLTATWDYLAKQINGHDGDELTSNNFTGSQSGKKGIYALEKADLFNLLCIPPYKETANGLDVETTVLTEAIAYCVKRRAMLIIDAPSGWGDKKAAKDGIDTDVVGSTSKNAAIFFPRLKMPNPLKDNQMEIFAACGAVAGVMARTDATRGVWKAPAGLDAVLRGVADFSVHLTDAENGELNPLGINCLRVKPPAGKIIWGARTREGNDMLASEWKYIPVRRLALYLEETLYRNTQWAVFEPNDEPLWAQLRLSIGAFMNNLFRQGAFQGSSPKDAYFVKCDKDTTTQYDIDRGIVNIIIGFAPLKPAEFVILKFQQIAGQS